MATLIIFFLFSKFQLHMDLGTLTRRIDIHLALESRNTLPYILQPHAFYHLLLVKAHTIILHRKGYTVLLLHKLYIDMLGLCMFERIIDQFVDTAIDHDLQLLRQAGFIPEIVKISYGNGRAEVG